MDEYQDTFVKQAKMYFTCLVAAMDVALCILVAWFWNEGSTGALNAWCAAWLVFAHAHASILYACYVQSFERLGWAGRTAGVLSTLVQGACIIGMLYGVLAGLWRPGALVGIAISMMCFSVALIAVTLTVAVPKWRRVPPAAASLGESLLTDV